MIAFTLPLDPHSVQHGGKRVAVINGKPRFFKTKKAASWANAVGLCANRYRPSQPFSCPVKLCVTFVIRRPQSLGGKKYPEGRLPAPKRPDLDNLQKGLQDALKGFWEDDSQIVELSLKKVYSAKGEEPKIEVEIHTYEEASETNERP